MADARDESAYEQALRDDRFRADVTEVYTGQHSVLDALWWLEHPTEPAPSGRTAPATELRDLQHQLFSKDGGGLADPAAASRLPELEAEIRFEREAIEDAVTTVLAARTAPRDSDTALDRDLDAAFDLDTALDIDLALAVDRVAAGVDAREPAGDPRRNDDSAHVGDPAHLTSSPSLSPALWRRPSRSTAIGLGITAALILGVGIGTQLGQGSADVSSATQPTTSATPTPTASRAKALDVFNTGQTPEDIPTQLIPDTFDQSTFRLLQGTVGEFFPVAYAVRSTSGLVCLLIAGSRLNYTASCVRDPDFPSMGMRLQTLTELTFPGATDPAQPTDITIVWATDGSVEMSGSGRQTPETAVEPAPNP
ncbi:hypothetical protein [Leifsonia sp. A12D58]|uniref:hypothetical protein n=1 Tax=Leifsonia sp. A12D58 TaxID=3397674 RepID=UPI0039DFCB62